MAILSTINSKLYNEDYSYSPSKEVSEKDWLDSKKGLNLLMKISFNDLNLKQK